jgi:hypothetical protein
MTPRQAYEYLRDKPLRFGDETALIATKVLAQYKRIVCAECCRTPDEENDCPVCGGTGFVWEKR